jgi:hypothetical protein
MIMLAMLSENVGIIGEWTTDKNVYSCKFPAWLRVSAHVVRDQKSREVWVFAKNVSPFDGLGATDSTVEIHADKLLVFPFEVHEADLLGAYNDLVKKHVEHCSGLVSASGGPLGMELQKP